MVEKYDIYVKKLGIKIRSLRKEKGMNQKLFGAEVGIDERQLRKIEKGLTNPRLDTIYNIARVLDIDLNELLPQGDKI